MKRKRKNQIDSSQITTLEEYLLQLNQTWQTAGRIDMSEEDEQSGAKKLRAIVIILPKILNGLAYLPPRHSKQQLNLLTRLAARKHLGCHILLTCLEIPYLLFGACFLDSSPCYFQCISSMRFFSTYEYDQLFWNL